MTYVRNSDDLNPDMRYEGLAMYAFDCERWGGPNDIAVANAYGPLFVPDITKEGIEVLIQILDALIKKEDDIKKKVEFTDLKASLNGGDVKQRTAISLIDYIIKIIQED